MLLQFLAASRFLLVVPVVGCVLLTVGVVVLGFGRIMTAGIKVVQAGDEAMQIIANLKRF